MNKRIKKKFMAKHGYKRYRNEVYRYKQSWIRTSSRYTIFGIPDPNWIRDNLDKFALSESKSEVELIDGTSAYMKLRTTLHLSGRKER